MKDDRTHRYATRALVVACALVLTASGLLLTACGAPAASTPGPATSGATTGGVQRFSVDLSTGAYAPDVIEAKAGIPIEITFGQGSGCLSTLVFPSFQIEADMTKGPRTFDLGAVKAGDYTWACGMDMQHGTLRVR